MHQGQISVNEKGSTGSHIYILYEKLVIIRNVEIELQDRLDIVLV